MCLNDSFTLFFAQNIKEHLEKNRKDTKKKPQNLAEFISKLPSSRNSHSNLVLTPNILV